MEPTSTQVTKAFGRVWKLCDEPQIESITIQLNQIMYYRRYNNSGFFCTYFDYINEGFSESPYVDFLIAKKGVYLGKQYGIYDIKVSDNRANQLNRNKEK